MWPLPPSLSFSGLGGAGQPLHVLSGCDVLPERVSSVSAPWPRPAQVAPARGELRVEHLGDVVRVFLRVGSMR